MPSTSKGPRSIITNRSNDKDLRSTIRMLLSLADAAVHSRRKGFTREPFIFLKKRSIQSNRRRPSSGLLARRVDHGGMSGEFGCDRMLDFATGDFSTFRCRPGIGSKVSEPHRTNWIKGRHDYNATHTNHWDRGRWSRRVDKEPWPEFKRPIYWWVLLFFCKRFRTRRLPKRLSGQISIG